MKESFVYNKKKTILLILLLFLILIGGLYIYVTHRPIFKLSGDNVEAFSIRNGNTGEFVDIEDEETINEIVDLMNSFRCWFLIPEIPGDRSGWSYAIVIYYNDTSESSSHHFTSKAIEVDNIWYFVNGSYLEQLIEIVS